jgi:hypothetical protein
MGWHRFSFIEIAEKFNKASKAGVSGADSYGMLLVFYLVFKATQEIRLRDG